MVNDRKQRQDFLYEAVETIGRVLRREFETEGQDVPDHIRRLLDQLEAKGKSKKEE